MIFTTYCIWLLCHRLRMLSSRGASFHLPISIGICCYLLFYAFYKYVSEFCWYYKQMIFTANVWLINTIYNSVLRLSQLTISLLKKNDLYFFFIVDSAFKLLTFIVWNINIPFVCDGQTVRSAMTIINREPDEIQGTGSEPRSGPLLYLSTCYIQCRRPYLGTDRWKCIPRDKDTELMFSSCEDS